MPKLIKKILLVYISIVLTFAPSSVFAASPAGWAFSKYDVATSVVTAMKNGASASVAVAKSPISQKIAKGIVGGAIAGAALPLAISQLTSISLEALDWVLDPANNAIKYKDKNAPTITPGKYYIACTTTSCNFDNAIYIEPYQSTTTFQNVCKSLATKLGRSGTVTNNGSHCIINNTSSLGYVYLVNNTDTPDSYKTIPIPTVASKIFDNAKTDTDSRSVVIDAVKDYVNEGSADTALDAAKSDADAGHSCGTGTHWSGSACVADTPSTPTDTPFDPTSIIDAIGKVFDAVMSLPDVINNALDSLLVDIKDFFQPVIDLVTDFFEWFKDTALEWKNDFVEEYRSFRDWFKSDPGPQTDNKPDIDTTPPTKSAQDFDSNYINFGGQCPSFSPTTISVGMVSVPISFNAQPLCDFAILCRPIILALAYFAAMAIVANAIRSE